MRALLQIIAWKVFPVAGRYQVSLLADGQWVAQTVLQVLASLGGIAVANSDRFSVPDPGKSAWDSLDADLFVVTEANFG
jgi:hypothetical protein